jgi:hypothetical protein
MKIFVLEKTNSKFVELTTSNLRTVSYKNFVYENDITEDRIIQWLVNKEIKINLDYLPVWQMLYEYMRRPYQNLEHWQYLLQCKANEIEAARIGSKTLNKAI